MGIAREVCNVAVTRSASASSGGGGRGGHVSTISEVVNDVDHDHRSPRIARFP